MPDGLSRKPRPRNAFLVFLFSLVFTPAMVLMWLGRPKLSILYLLVPAGAVVGAILWYQSGGIAQVPPVEGGYLALLVFAGATYVVVGLALALILRLWPRHRRWHSNFLFACIVYPALVGAMALGVRIFGIQTFTIPGTSMNPTLVSGDVVAVWKGAYGYGTYSAPFDLIPPGKRYLDRTAMRGDVVAFYRPRQGVYYMKRIIGLPGETVQLKGGVVYVNGVPFEQTRITNAGDLCPDDTKCTVLRETTPENRSYLVLSLADGSAGDDTAEFTVPEGYYFVLGDNRDDSRDSRFPLGYIPQDQLVGRVDMVLWNDRVVPYNDRLKGYPDRK